MEYNKLLKAWYERQEWSAFPFQESLAQAYAEGLHGLLNAPTGSGKTYAMFLPALCYSISQESNRKKAGHLRIIWITPLRALARDIMKALQHACDTMESGWQVQMRTGDTDAKTKQAQKKKMPEVLIITPESLHVLLAAKGYPALFSSLEAVVVDEWHELLGSKRGVQVELALSRLRALSPAIRTWGISATIGNLVEAMEVLVGTQMPPDKTTVVRSDIKKEIAVHTVLPEKMDLLPWAGHIGLSLLPRIIDIIWSARTVLIFTNTRAMAEIWYHQILQAEEELAGQLAMHHGSLSREVRDWVESSLHAGTLKAVIATSSLDLGVDFRPVDTVIQIGSPKGVARFTQRAGRSGHQPGAVSNIYFIPTHALELVEVAALKEAIGSGIVERREPFVQSFDVLVQYLVTLSIGEGFREKEILREVKATHAFHEMTRDEWEWCLAFITHGGKAFEAYDDFNRVEVQDGRYRIANRTASIRHRLQIGTIVSDPVVRVSYLKGGTLGTIEEYFIARLKPGDVFWFAGLCLEFVMLKDMTALVRRTKEQKAGTASYQGGRMPLSGYLAEVMRKQLHEAEELAGTYEEYAMLAPLLDLQRNRTAIPAPNELLVEYSESEDGVHLFFYPFEGRLMHEVMGSLAAFRLSRELPVSISLAMNDYGFELLCNREIELTEDLVRRLLDPQKMDEDVFGSVNAMEMARRKFRDIAVISGMVFQGYPGKIKKNRHLQSSSQLMFDVLTQYDPGHLLLRQSYEEVINDQMDQARLRKALIRIHNGKVLIRKTSRFSPFSFPIVVDSMREKMSSERMADRIRRMVEENGG
ncbi:MAG TPA: ligase-associated DNA damage response DEXH box helicase [Chitinophagales bacterium]|nr:ligase-associated DNA damage response DEXH box helicase [Chitinophagales bacterium]